MLVAFGGLKFRLGIPPFEFVQITEALDVDVVFVRDLSQSFYQRGVPGLGETFPEMATSLQPYVDAAPRSVCIGNSAGGFPALILGSMCGASEVQAFSPLTFLDRARRFRHHDKRWSKHIDPVNRGPERQRAFLDTRPIVREHPATSVTIHYSNDLRIDRAHARRMSRCPNVTLDAVPGRNHFVIREMRASGQLEKLLRAALFGPSDEPRR